MLGTRPHGNFGAVSGGTAARLCGGLAVVSLALAACGGGSSDTTSAPTDSAATTVPGTAFPTESAAPTLPVALPTAPAVGCVTNGKLSGAFELEVKDAITQVNTQNVGENAPDAYYSTYAGKNTIGYFAFGKKATVVVNGDGSWTGETGGEGTIEVASDGTSATVSATLEGSDSTGQRAKPLTVDLVTKCGVTLPTTLPPKPVDTKQNFTEKIVEETLPTTPSGSANSGN